MAVNADCGANDTVASPPAQRQIAGRAAPQNNARTLDTSIRSRTPCSSSYNLHVRRSYDGNSVSMSPGANAAQASAGESFAVPM